MNTLNELCFSLASIGLVSQHCGWAASRAALVHKAGQASSHCHGFSLMVWWLFSRGGFSSSGSHHGFLPHVFPQLKLLVEVFAGCVASV